MNINFYIIFDHVEILDNVSITLVHFNWEIFIDVIIYLDWQRFDYSFVLYNHFSKVYLNINQYQI